MTQRRWPVLTTATVVAIGLACTAPRGRRDAPTSAAPLETASRVPTLDHLTPPRDSSGPVPARFEWTPVEGADRYAIGVWSEVDVLVWRQGNVPSASVAWPTELSLEPGTYYWSVTALRDDRAVAESGLAAFVVRR